MASILLVDDNEDFREITADVLRQAGHTVSTASDGETGLAHYHAKHHDVIITDIVMPGMEGLEMIANLRYAVPRPRIIAISGDSKFSEPLYLPTARKLGVLRTLSKPVQPDALLKALDEVLAEPKPPTVRRPQSG